MFRDSGASSSALDLVTACPSVVVGLPCALFSARSGSDADIVEVTTLSSISGFLNIPRNRATRGRVARHRSPPQPLHATACKVLEAPELALTARTADLICGIDPNLGGRNAALIAINQNTEQHRCAAV